MPSLIFTAKALKDLVCPAGTAKIDFHDKGCKGLMLEARMSGKRTWYLRYRDARGTQRQFRLADAQDLPLELARKRADELRWVFRSIVTSDSGIVTGQSGHRDHRFR